MEQVKDKQIKEVEVKYILDNREKDSFILIPQLQRRIQGQNYFHDF